MQILVCMRVLPAYLYEDSPVRLAADEWMKKGHRAIGFYFVDEFDASCLAYVNPLQGRDVNWLHLAIQI